ncbi:MAG: hypothetical protein VCB77_05195 [Alphaproteobacteria bacterium]
MAARDGRLRRNFQGHTTEPAEVLLGLGTSAIGTLPQGYVQNASRTTDYCAAIESGGFATARSIAVSDDDRLRRRVIECLMCQMEVDLEALCGGADRALAAFGDDLAALALLISGFWKVSTRFDSATMHSLEAREIAALSFSSRLAITPVSPVSTKASDTASETFLRMDTASLWAWVRCLMISIRSTSWSTDLLSNSGWATSMSSFARANTNSRGASSRSDRSFATSLRTDSSTW